ncbi:hypothetical protein TIFTF001_002426 [Ficus carica]|uniref:Uncharacterized protein n=1 Tax=Ficus carica TaxID=3494 RepID=A0AA87ZMP5_FICCA|nr:hypothetical protein TIFTF001_002426 [Ficus carica]
MEGEALACLLAIQLMQNTGTCSVCFGTRRTGNVAAHKLARWAISSSCLQLPSPLEIIAHCRCGTRQDPACLLANMTLSFGMVGRRTHDSSCGFERSRAYDMYLEVKVQVCTIARISLQSHAHTGNPRYDPDNLLHQCKRHWISEDDH